jgi:PAS domain S-box-containing protein
MDKQGIILKINHAFNIRFGYTAEELTGKKFSVLFTEKDNEKNKPELEIQKAITEGSANDENYLVHKDGNKIWVTGESVFIEQNDGSYIVKVIHNIHAQKQLERFLMQSHEFIDTVFESIRESALMILDSRIRIVKVNAAFLVTHHAGKEKIFEMETKRGTKKKISFQAKLVDGIPETERKLLIMIKVIN